MVVEIHPPVPLPLVKEGDMRQINNLPRNSVIETTYHILYNPLICHNFRYLIKRNSIMKIEYLETNQQGLDLIGTLWQKLIEYHKTRFKHFAEHLERVTFDLRKKELLEKTRDGALRIDLAKDMNTGELVGYCVSTVSGNRQGEIDSIYIESDYRQSGIGDNLMKRTLRWMDDMQVTKKILVVGAGNEEVFAFYSRYNFYPRSIVLEQVKTGK